MEYYNITMNEIIYLRKLKLNLKTEQYHFFPDESQLVFKKITILLFFSKCDYLI